MSVYGAPSSLPAQRACKMAIGPACGGPLGEMPGAKATPILTDILEQFGTSEAIRSWNSLEHLKLRGLIQSSKITYMQVSKLTINVTIKRYRISRYCSSSTHLLLVL